MSNRYQAGILLPGYDALKVPNPPTIGTATSASGTTVSVTFTAPSCVGGGAISSYQVFACCGARSGFGASSPITVSGLTTGTAYTFKAIARNVYGPSYPSAASNSVTPVAIGQQAFTTAGSFSWVAPAGVTSVSIVAVGAGGSGGGSGGAYGAGSAGGGALVYGNNISVTPGTSYPVVVGAGGTISNANNGSCGGSSYFCSTGVLRAFGGGLGQAGPNGGGGGAGGTSSGTAKTGGGNGGQGGGVSGFYTQSKRTGGGGAGGYTGNGGAGMTYCSTTTINATAGSGGGGGGGKCGFCCYPGTRLTGSGGGGVGILGAGCSGAAGCGTGNLSGGRGGSGGNPGNRGPAYSGANAGSGGSYGGGGGGAGFFCSAGGAGGVGAVRIIWPGTTRSFPSTSTGDL